jgi:hypothetical protein
LNQGFLQIKKILFKFIHQNVGGFLCKKWRAFPNIENTSLTLIQGRDVCITARKKIRKGEGKGQNFFLNVAYLLISPSASKQVPYHGGLWVVPMAEWLKHSALTYRMRVRSRAQKSFFILLSKVKQIFAYPHFYARNTMALLFFRENFRKI